MENVFSTSVKDKLNVEFKHLPDFAAYILHQQFDQFVKEVIRLYDVIDVPLARLFKSMSAEQRQAIAEGSLREMLTLVASGHTGKYIDQAVQTWSANESPVIPADQLHSQDITLVNYIRSKSLRYFIPGYTADPQHIAELVEEIDRFIVILTSELLASYIQTQKNEIQTINNALKNRERQLLEAQEIGRVGSFEWDLHGNQSAFTPQLFNIFEMESSTNLTSFLEELEEEEREKVRRALDKAFTDGDFYCEFRFVKNNQEKFILSRGRVVFEEGKPMKMLGTVTDVTERHNIIEKLKESESLYKQAQALTHIGNWSWDLQTRKIIWSDELYRIFGLEPGAAELSYESFFSFVHPDHKDKVSTMIQKALQTLKMPEFHFQIISAKGFVKVLRGKGEIIADHHHKPLAMLGTCQDVTREFMLTKQLREREKYLEELNQSLQLANQELSRTNEELESFNFIASHDLQEPLRKIQVYSNRILDTGFEELSPSLQDYFHRINNASKRMQKLIEDFLAFSQTFKVTQNSEHVDMAQLMAEVKIELRTRIEDKKARLEVRDLPPVYGVPFQIKQLMTNLVSNALKYSHPELPPHIVISGEVVSGAEIPVEGANPRISYTKIAVADNGIGFEAKYAAKIFELFQRLHGKNTYSGTGIGLALCKKIVLNMNGFIAAESQPGKGSVFTIYVPVREP